MSWRDWLGLSPPGSQTQPPPLAALAPPPVTQPRARAFSPIPTTGPTLANYPTPEDALAARRGGFGYGEPTSAYIEGTAGRIFGTPRGALPAEGAGKVVKTGITQEPDYAELMQRSLRTPTTTRMSPDQQALVQDAHTRAALAVNYSPLAALGYNPRKITADVSGRSELGQQIAGLTNPETGEMHYQARSPRTIVHESLHRGLLALKDDRRLPAYLRARIADDTDEESLVRQLMHQQAGNPETSDAAQQQRMAGSQWTPEEIALINKLAQEKIAKNRPRGPR